MDEIVSTRIDSEPDIVRVRQFSDVIGRTFGLQSFARTRFVTAVLEIARNALQYAGGGRAHFGVRTDEASCLLVVRVVDQGDGIDGISRIDGAQRPILPAVSQPEGLGLGLSGARRLADRFDLVSTTEGTKVILEFVVPAGKNEVDLKIIEATRELEKLGALDPVSELSRQNRELTAAMAERELLIDEVHHRTGNNLALISSFIQLSKRNARSEETRQTLTDLEARVHSIAMVHQELQRVHGFDRVTLLPLIESVTEHTREAFSSSGLEISISALGEQATIAGGPAIDVVLIINELITNAFKHAFEGRSKGHIDIEFEQVEGEENNWVLTIRDDGVGLPPETRPERSNSLGWRMIRAMTARHEGEIRTESDDGFRVTFTFPALFAEKSQDRPPIRDDATASQPPGRHD